RLQMGEARRTDLALVGLVGAVRDEIDAELALGRFNGSIGLAGGYMHALGVKLEMMDERFHRLLHVATAGRRDLVIVEQNRPLPFGDAQLLDTLLHDADRLAHLFHADAIAVEAIAVLAD